MTKLPALRPKKVIKTLKKGRFIIDHQTGSHVIMYSEEGNKRVTVPFHNKDLKKRTLKSIIHQAGLTNKEFMELLK